MYKSGWIILNGVPTSVRTWGCWITEELKSDSVILFITGNPGITDFYKHFLSNLHELTNIPVWVLCHAGNEVPREELNLSLPSFKTNPDLYNLKGQTIHKQEFIYKYIPESKYIYLIGHSIGAKISIQLLKDEKIAKRTKQVHLICPALQNISETPNGKVFRHFLSRISPLLIMLAWVFAFLPFKMRAYLIYAGITIFTHSCTVESCCVVGLIKLFTPAALKHVFFFANDEMVNVKDLDNEVYEEHYDKINVYYGQNDRWAPVSQWEDLKKKHPRVNNQLLEPRFTHPFVFSSSKEAAILLAKGLNENNKFSS